MLAFSHALWTLIYQHTYLIRFNYIFKYKRVFLKNFFPTFFKQYNVILTHIPKTAGTSLRHSIGITENIPHLPIKWYKEKYGDHLLSKMFKFSFVRHPVTRLLSAYFFLKGGGYKGIPEDNFFSEKVMSQFSSFHEFLEWFSPSKVWVYIHFFPQSYFICDSKGNIYQDWIGRFEQIEKDYEQLRELLAQRGIQAKPLAKRNVTQKKNTPKLSKQEIYKIYEIYKSDFDLLNYDPENF
ncbi:MAG: sulfotransferase family protein [Chlorobi bacterium]|nr:sulfotransferase family protein [Chlorobiota bacterium]